MVSSLFVSCMNSVRTGFIGGGRGGFAFGDGSKLNFIIAIALALNVHPFRLVSSAVASHVSPAGPRDRCDWRAEQI